MACCCRVPRAPTSRRRIDTLAGSISGTTDYVFRGFSQTAGSPAIQGTVDFGYKMFYAGVFLSSLDFVNNSQLTGVADVEVDVYAGVKFPVGKIDVDLGVIYYAYPGANDSFAKTGFRELDYVELKAGASFKPLSQWTLGIVAYYSPEYTNKTGKVWTFEGTSAYEFAKIGSITPTFSSVLGYQIGDTHCLQGAGRQRRRQLPVLELRPHPRLRRPLLARLPLLGYQHLQPQQLLRRQHLPVRRALRRHRQGHLLSTLIGRQIAPPIA